LSCATSNGNLAISQRTQALFVSILGRVQI
jgi:hypothetical protein